MHQVLAVWESSAPDGMEYKDVLKERRMGKKRRERREKSTKHFFHTCSETQYWYYKYLLNHNRHVNNCASLGPCGLRPAIDNTDDGAYDNKREQMRCTVQHA